MGDGSERGLVPGVEKVWTFRITGGEDFSMSMPRTPVLEHTGRTTLWKMIGTVEVMEAAKTLIRQCGAAVEAHTEGQSTEQAAIRRERLGLES